MALLSVSGPTREGVFFDDRWQSFVGPSEDWGKLIGDVPAAAAILDRFLHHAELIEITGKSDRLKDDRSKS